MLAAASAVVVASVALVLLLLHGGHHATPPSADASASASASGPACRGAACDGADPMRMRCAPAPVSLAVRRARGGAYVELRYGTACGASWARTWGARVGDRVEVSAAGAVRGATVADRAATDAFVYTAMVTTPPGTALRVCLRPAGGTAAECWTSRVPRAAG
ncbi:hypothetical protein WN71_035310 [Streptomyces mangrovisoli]|uniref:DUF2690 domain-containing protein n=1 Tax=Streptomyces mangrovisoli TaxID=1428628 RepID=A0A1J4NLM9_9ACTN|nr:hypothetical protein WN71_035310 [Streptomyces mangrovisoli]